VNIDFIPWDIIQYHFIFLLTLFQLWPSGALLVDSYIPLTYPHCCMGWGGGCSFIWAISYFLVLQDTPGSSQDSASVLELAISPRSPGSFYWKMVLKTKIWVVGVLIVTGCHLVFSLVYKSFATNHTLTPPWMWTTMTFLSWTREIVPNKPDTVSLCALHTLISSFNPQSISEQWTVCRYHYYPYMRMLWQNITGN